MITHKMNNETNRKILKKKITKRESKNFNWILGLLSLITIQSSLNLIKDEKKWEKKWHFGYIKIYSIRRGGNNELKKKTNSLTLLKSNLKSFKTYKIMKINFMLVDEKEKKKTSWIKI
jgi:hypothetical protein